MISTQALPLKFTIQADRAVDCKPLPTLCRYSVTMIELEPGNAVSYYLEMSLYCSCRCGSVIRTGRLVHLKDTSKWIDDDTLVWTARAVVMHQP